MRRQFASLLLARVYSTGITALLLILLARWSGVEDFGLVSIIIAIGALLFTLAEWGLSSYAPRARATNNNADVLGGLRFAGTSIGAAALIFCASIIAINSLSGNNITVALLALSLAIERFIEVGLTVLIADGLKRPVFVNIVTQKTMSICIFLGFTYLGISSTESYVLAQFLAAILGVCLLFFALRPILSMESPPTGLLALAKKLSPFVVANVSSQARSLDTVIVAGCASVASAGLYAAAFRLINPILLIPASLISILLPHSARIDRKSALQLAVKILAVAVIGSTPLIFIALNGEYLIGLLMGDDFTQAAPILTWALASVPFVAASGPLGSILQGQGLQNYVALNGVIFAGITLVLVFAGVTFFGPAGGAAGIALSYAPKSLSLVFRLSKYTRLPSHSSA